MEIFKLFGSILVDNEKANKSISETDGKAGGLATKLGDGIKTAAKWGAAITGAAVAGGAALFGMASKAMDSLDRIDKLSQKIGVSRDSFQTWEYVLSQSGTDIEKMQVGLKTMVQRMDETVQGTGKGAEMFGKLGVSVKDSTGKMRAQEDVFNDTVMALTKMPEGAEKSRLAFELFGKAGMELMPLLNSTSEDVEFLKDRAHELGIVLSDDAVDAGVKFQDTMDDLKRTFGAVITNVGAELIPIFQGLADWVFDHMPQIQKIVHTAFDVIKKIVTTVYEIYRDNILPIFSIFFDWIMENMPTIERIVKTVFEAIWDIVKKVWDIFRNDLLPILKGLYDFVAPTFPAIGGIIEAAFKVIVGAVKLGIDIFERVTSAIKTAIDWLKKWNKTEAEEKTVSVKETKTTTTTGSSNKLDRYASGTDSAPGGWAIVGEKGPELMYVPKGSQIIPNESLGTVSRVEHSGVITVKGVNDEDQLIAVTEIVRDELRREVRAYA